jgi:hypothetical protein
MSNDCNTAIKRRCNQNRLWETLGGFFGAKDSGQKALSTLPFRLNEN